MKNDLHVFSLWPIFVNLVSPTSNNTQFFLFQTTLYFLFSSGRTRSSASGRSERDGHPRHVEPAKHRRTERHHQRISDLIRQGMGSYLFLCLIITYIVWFDQSIAVLYNESQITLNIMQVSILTKKAFKISLKSSRIS